MAVNEDLKQLVEQIIKDRLKLRSNKKRKKF